MGTVIPLHKGNSKIDIYDTPDGEQVIIYDGKHLLSANFSTLAFQEEERPGLSFIFTMFNENDMMGSFFPFNHSSEIDELIHDLTEARNLMRKSEDEEA